MKKQCFFCAKKYNLVWRRVKLKSRYNPTAKRRQEPNLQWVKLSSGKRVLACAKCIKTMGKRK
ncbi:MAG: 50S ribosomal protein L28 [Candidatus Nealsonbacteria bacterium]|nr:50S ribosomal protein L28 [Candidatus Nealsonbacteria bacterium]